MVISRLSDVPNDNSADVRPDRVTRVESDGSGGRDRIGFPDVERIST